MKSPKAPETITSPQNPRIKEAAKLRDSGARKAAGFFLVEGAREIDRALRSRWEIAEIFICDALLSEAARRTLSAHAPLLASITLPIGPAAFAKLALREGSDGVVAKFKMTHHQLADLPEVKCPLLICVESVEKPGNLGAIIRTADGAGAHGVVVIDPLVDLFNPQVIRASLGACFHTKVVTTTPAEFRAYCRTRSIAICAAALDPRAVFYASLDFRRSSAILLGSEAQGLSPFWLTHADHLMSLPMAGIADSLNVSATAAVLAYEAVRQRR